ncbi:MAG TPA: GspH/FimT family protein [Candidatus Polarisedimenticolia bacterium]
MLAALTIAALGMGVAVPSISTMLSSWKLTCAARDLATELQRTRMEALARGANVGIQFENTLRGDRWRLYLDGGSRGIHAAEIAAGIDTPLSMTFDLSSRYPGVRFGVARAGAPRIPPATGSLAPTDDPIALGGSDIFSASPTGESSSGTLYLTDGGSMRAVTVFGATGRIRIWRYDGRSGQWRS